VSPYSSAVSHRSSVFAVGGHFRNGPARQTGRVGVRDGSNEPSRGCRSRFNALSQRHRFRCIAAFCAVYHIGSGTGCPRHCLVSAPPPRHSVSVPPPGLSQSRLLQATVILQRNRQSEMLCDVYRYKAYFRWGHYPFKLKSGPMLPDETEACASVTSAFLQVSCSSHPALGWRCWFWGQPSQALRRRC